MLRAFIYIYRVQIGLKRSQGSNSVGLKMFSIVEKLFNKTKDNTNELQIACYFLKAKLDFLKECAPQLVGLKTFYYRTHI